MFQATNQNIIQDGTTHRFLFKHHAQCLATLPRPLRRSFRPPRGLWSCTKSVGLGPFQPHGSNGSKQWFKPQNNSTCIQHQRHLFRMVEPGWVDLSWDLCCSWVSFVHGYAHYTLHHLWVGGWGKQNNGWMLARALEPKWHPWQAIHPPTP